MKTMKAPKLPHFLTEGEPWGDGWKDNRGPSPQEYAGMWGCDSSYDRHPCLPGDGAKFYNFGSVIGGRASFLAEFLPAIDRLIGKVKVSLGKETGWTERHVANLEVLRKYVVALLEYTNAVDQAAKELVAG